MQLCMTGRQTDLETDGRGQDNTVLAAWGEAGEDKPCADARLKTEAGNVDTSAA